MRPASEIHHHEEEEQDRLEQGLLLLDDDGGYDSEHDSDENEIVYRAGFVEDGFVNYKTAQWLLYSLLLTLAWGVGLIMFLYLPVRRSVLRRILTSRKLYVTSHAIVYKVAKPVIFPCFGILKKEKHVLLPSISDIVIEQGYLQSHFGVYSIRIENVGVRRPPSDDVQIDGIANPRAFKKAVLTHLSNMRSQAYYRQGSTLEDTSRMGHSSVPAMSPSKFPRHEAISPVGELVILQKLEEVGSSVKRVQALIEEQQPKISEHAD